VSTVCTVQYETHMWTQTTPGLVFGLCLQLKTVDHVAMSPSLSISLSWTYLHYITGPKGPDAALPLHTFLPGQDSGLHQGTYKALWKQESYTVAKGRINRCVWLSLSRRSLPSRSSTSAARLPLPPAATFLTPAPPVINCVIMHYHHCIALHCPLRLFLVYCIALHCCRLHGGARSGQGGGLYRPRVGN
jgi:hypothetical protein